jgi:hypothetical protein
MNVTVHVREDSDFKALKFDVDMGSLPQTTSKGYEVVVIFGSPQIKNNNTFYTDSNGL